MGVNERYYICRCAHHPHSPVETLYGQRARHVRTRLHVNLRPDSLDTGHALPHELSCDYSGNLFGRLPGDRPYDNRRSVGDSARIAGAKAATPAIVNTHGY